MDSFNQYAIRKSWMSALSWYLINVNWCSCKVSVQSLASPPHIPETLIFHHAVVQKCSETQISVKLFSWEHLKYQNSHPGAHFGTGLGSPGRDVVNLGIPSGLYVFLSVCLPVSNITKQVMNVLQWIFWEVRGGKRNKWLHFGSNPDHNPALVEVCALWVLGIWWLPIDI